MPTGTNLLGLIKHQAAAEFGYFGDTFDRPFPDRTLWSRSESGWDLFAQPEESREFIVDRYRRAWAHADTTITALALDAIGRVPWWPADTNDVTLHQVLVHLTAETSRHAGHADIIREPIDGAAGLTAGNPNIASGDRAWWDGYHRRVEHAAHEAATRADEGV